MDLYSFRISSGAQEWMCRKRVTAATRVGWMQQTPPAFDPPRTGSGQAGSCVAALHMRAGTRYAQREALDRLSPPFTPAAMSRVHPVPAQDGQRGAELVPPDAWQAPYPPDDAGSEKEGGGFPIRRILGAVLRHKWIVVLSMLVGGVGAYGIWRVVEPVYLAEGNLWVEVEDRSASGPISEGGLLTESAWVELLKSYAVLDPVVIEQRKFIRSSPELRPMFRDFTLAERFRPGDYRLQVDPSGARWTLYADGLRVEEGAVGDSVGEQLGFRWLPPGQTLRADASYEFSVVTPRDAARELGQRLQAQMDIQGNFIALTLEGVDGNEIADLLNGVMERHVELSAELKRAKLDERTVILEEQLRYAEEELRAAEQELEAFRVNTITLPSDQAPIAAGLEVTRDPVIQNFFQTKMELEQLRQDRARLAQAMTSEDGPRIESLEAIAPAQRSAELRGAIQELIDARSELRALRSRYTVDYGPVQDLLVRIRRLETETIPAIVRSVDAELASTEQALEETVATASTELGNIPPRTIEEARLQRRVAIQERLYNDLRQRVETSRLAAASSIPDVRILDRAAAPQVPAEDPRMRLMMMVVFGCIGAGLLGAVLLDRMDPTVHDPMQVRDDLGLPVLGAIPKIDAGRDPEGARVAEAFRELRLNVEYAHGAAGPLVVTITSPGQGEGKTLVSVNLAIAFAGMGRRTLLIDGDTRMGDAHTLLGVERKPGLMDYLEQRAGREILQSTSYANLDVLAAGSRMTNSPELLASDRMRRLFPGLKKGYDAIVVDSPPLAAGGDALMLAAMSGTLALVVRSGTSNREMISAKLEALQRFPVRVLGAILNDFSERGNGRYRYYSNYIPGYEPRAETPTSLPKGEGDAEDSPPEDEDAVQMTVATD